MDLNINIDEYMKRFRIFYPQTLFEPNWKALNINCCPLCGNKLKLTLNKKIIYCKGVKHRKPFIMRKKLSTV